MNGKYCKSGLRRSSTKKMKHAVNHSSDATCTTRYYYIVSRGDYVDTREQLLRWRQSGSGGELIDRKVTFSISTFQQGHQEHRISAFATMDEQMDLDTTTQEILLAASNHDIYTLRNLLRSCSANVQDEETGSTPLHAAVAACEEDAEAVEEKKRMNEDEAAAIATAALTEEEAVKTIKFLFANGAIWNDLDNNNETPGDIAFRLGLKSAYSSIVDAGVRAELLLNRLDDFDILPDADEEEESEYDGEVEEGDEAVQSGADGEEMQGEDTAPELVQVNGDGQNTTEDVNSARYLASELSFGGDRLLDADKNGVMMAWETDIMRQTADALVPEQGLRILNVGHGMGIVDGIFQDKRPASHHIIEAHPEVIERMGKENWADKKGVKVHKGRWQDVVPQLAESGEVFDAIYFDTFAEDYKALKEFFAEHVITLLDQKGRFGFFNGLGADRQVCYDVYTKVVEIDLFDAGLDTAWKEIKIPDLQEQGEWEGVRRKYWALETYRMPTCSFLG